MVDELLGDIYENVTSVAIRDYSSILQSGESVFRHVHPPGISVEPDLTIGASSELPRVLFLVSHTNAERASEKKSWRNVGEYVDARLAMGNSITIVNILFDSRQKRKWASASNVLFDAFLEADRQEFGVELIELCSKLIKVCKKKPKSDEARLSAISKYIADNPPSAAVVRSFAQEIEALIAATGKGSTGWHPAFAKSMAGRTTPRIPNARTTALRRGLGRFLPLKSEKEMRRLVRLGKERKPGLVPDYFIRLKLATPSLRGHVIVDNEIRECVDLLAEDTLVGLWAQSRKSSKALRQAAQLIEHSSSFSLFHSFVVENYDKLVIPKQLEQSLIDCFEHPNLVMGQTIQIEDVDTSGAWLFPYLMTLVKAHSGSQQGYGYSKLSKDAGLMVEGKRSIIDFVLPKYISRTKPLDSAVCSGISVALSQKLGTIGKKWIKESGAEAGSFHLRTVYEDKVYKMAAFDPLLFLLLETNTISTDDRVKRYPSFLTQSGESGVATCDVILVSQTLIMWQSASPAGVRHKVNELCGRIGMLRVVLDSAGAPKPTSTFQKAILLIDGPWTDSDLQRLHASGFDEVFYPDEMDKLAAAIK